MRVEIALEVKSGREDNHIAGEKWKKSELYLQLGNLLVYLWTEGKTNNILFF